MASNRDPAGSQLRPTLAASDPAGEKSGADTGRANRTGRRWFHPSGDWKGKRALLPGNICFKVFDVYAWGAALVGVTSGVLVYVQNAHPLRENPLYWIYCVAALAQMVTAILRGLPFGLRYVTFMISLLISTGSAAFTFGITPNWLFGLLMMVTSTGLFFGIRAGFLALGAVCAITSVVAWARITGVFPLSVSEAAAAAIYLDFRSPSVWTRIVLATAVFMTALLVVMRHVLRSLNDALKESTAVAHHLALEREQRAKAVEALQTSEEKFSKAFRSGPDAMSIAELETGRYLEVNEGFLRLFGYRHAEVIGRTSIELGIWRDPAQRQRLWSRSGRSKRCATCRSNVLAAGAGSSSLCSARSACRSAR